MAIISYLPNIEDYRFRRLGSDSFLYQIALVVHLSSDKGDDADDLLLNAFRHKAMLCCNLLITQLLFRLFFIPTQDIYMYILRAYNNRSLATN